MNIIYYIIPIVFICCNTISVQSINIDYNNSLWSFDYMRDSCKANIDFLETEYRIQNDSTHVKQEFSDFYGQALMTVQTFNGKISEKDHTYLLFRNPIKKLKQSEKLLDKFIIICGFDHNNITAQVA